MQMTSLYSAKYESNAKDSLKRAKEILEGESLKIREKNH